MAFDPDQIPEELRAILGDRPQGPRPPLAYPSPQPAMPMAGATPPLQAAVRPPMPSPAATMRPAPTMQPSMTVPPSPLDAARTGFQTSNQKLSDYADQVQATQRQLAALKPPNAADYRPKLWERFAGAGLALTQLRNPENAGALASSVVNRRFNAANEQYGRQRGSLMDQLQAEREGMEPLKAVNEGAWRTFQAAQSGEKEQALEQYRNDLNEIKQDIANGKHQDAEAKLNEIAENNKNNFELRREVLKMQQELNDAKEDKLRNGGGKDHTNTSVQIESRKAQALAKAQREYQKATQEAGNDPELRKQADESFRQAQQDAQDAYEAEIAAAGGTPQHEEVSEWGKKPTSAGPQASAPAAAKSTTQTKHTPEQIAVAQTYLKKAGWDGTGKPTDEQKAKARTLAKADGHNF